MRTVIFIIGAILYLIGIVLIKTSAWYALLLLILPILGIYYRYKDGI